MLRRAMCLTALCLAACLPPAPEPRVVLADETSLAAGSIPPETSVAADGAGSARAFFFAQADLYLAGASPSGNSKLGDVLRAMGRNDLVEALAPAPAEFACPRQWVEPIEMIARAAATSQIVIVESDRRAPVQTAFVQGIVARLAADGFAAYADDGLTLDPGGAAHPAVLLVSEGMVTRDPGHGRLLREVKRNGLQLVDAGIWWTSAGELAALPSAELAMQRQTALAEQVSRRVFAKDPAARVIFHTSQSEDPAAAASLKQQVARLTGREPLLVSLTNCASEIAEAAFVPSLGEGAKPGGQADLSFAIPRASVSQGRLTTGPLDRTVSVPLAFRTSDMPVLVEARRKNDPDLAVPEDRLLLFPGDALPLILPPGEYRIEAWTKGGPLAAPVAESVS